MRDDQFLREVRCLYFDDEPDELDRFSDLIGRAWRELNNRVPISVDKSSDVNEAINKLRNTRNKYHIFVADIFVKNPKNKKKRRALGLLAIRNARQDDKDLAIVALTVGNGIYPKKAIKMGADEYVEKDDILQEESNLLGETLLSALRNHHYAPYPSKAHLKINETDYVLLDVVDTIGRNHVIYLTEEILENPCTVIEPYYIRSGLSGATVLRIDFDLENDVNAGKKSAENSLLLKVSKDKEALTSESSKDTSLFSGLFISYKGQVKSSYNWHAIGLEFKLGGQTFLDWLISKESADQVADVLSKLFLDGDRGLIKVYRKRLSPDDEKVPNSVLWEMLTSEAYGYRRARILLALKEFRSLVGKYDRLKLYDETLIKEFLSSSQRVGDLNKDMIAPKATFFCLSHGDLHARNLLVSQYGTPFLIDPANVDQMHWAADVARLSVDLIVSGWDSGGESYEWDNIPKWCEVARKFILGEDLPREKEGTANFRIQTALSWIRAHLRDIHDIQDEKLKPEWEYRLALTIEFMRAAYRSQDLTAPKRVLGLLAASQGLRETNRAYIEFKKKFGGDI